MKNKNACDYDHQTNEETRLLPTGGSGNVIVCRRHYDDEIEFRKRTARETGGNANLPEWDSLNVYEKPLTLSEIWIGK